MTKLLLFFSFLIGLGLPCNTGVANVSIVLFCITAISFNFKRIKFSNQNQFLFSSTILFFSLSIISILYTVNFDTTLTSLGRRVSYILLPLTIIFLDDQLLKKIRKSGLLGITIGCIISGAYLLITILIKYFSHKGLNELDIDVFNYYHTYHNFTAPVDIHPTYLGSYFLLCLSFLCLYFSKKIKLTLKFFCLFLIFFVLLIILFINSRVIIFLASIIILIFLIYILFNTFFINKLYFFISIILLFVLLSVMFKNIQNTYIYYRFTHELKWESTGEKNSRLNKDSGGDTRIARWKSIIDISKNRPLIGFGSGVEKVILKEQFLKDNLNFSAENSYDSHNQYLSYLIQFGIIGLTTIIFYMFTNLFISFKSKDYIALIFFISISFICVFENYMNNNAGIVFIAFFGNILSKNNLEKIKKS